MSNSVRENRARRAAVRQGLNLVKSKTRDPRALSYGRWWVTSGAEVPVPDLKYAAGLQDVERLLAGELPPGFSLVQLYDGAAERNAWIIGSLIATTGDQHAYLMPGDRIGVYDTGQGLLDVFADAGEFLSAGYDGELTAQVAGVLDQEEAATK